MTTSDKVHTAPVLSQKVGTKISTEHRQHGHSKLHGLHGDNNSNCTSNLAKWERQKGMVNKNSSKRPTCVSEQCTFGFIIFCATNDKWYISQRRTYSSKTRQSSNTYHTNHLPINSDHITTRTGK